MLTDHESGGFRHDHCTALLDHADGDTVISSLFDNADCATDTLLVYFAGHGLPGTRSKELYPTLAAVGDNQLAYAPPGDAHTAFTGKLLKVLRDGVPRGPKLLTLNTVYLELNAALTSRDLHRPRQNKNDTVAGLALTRNPAHGHNEDRQGLRPRRPPQAARTGVSLTATPVNGRLYEKADALTFSRDGGVSPSSREPTRYEPSTPPAGVNVLSCGSTPGT